MARSLQPGAWEKLSGSLARSVASNLAERDLIGSAQEKVTDIKTALSSWDNCMAANFCKYPVIAIMVVGGLIILAIVTCIVRCCCCAKSCCCSCFACFKCCGNCCGCCDPPDSRKHKYLDEPYIPPNQGYRTEGPMHAAYPPVMGGASHGVTPPQYAEFDVKKGGEDSLPQMPSWEGAGSKKVELEQESHELNNLNKSPTGTTEQKDPLMTGMTPTSPMPRENIPSPNPYGRSTPTPAAMVGAHTPAARDPYARNNPYDTQQQDGFGLDQPYDLPPAGTPAGGAMAAVPGGRNSPAAGRPGYGPRRMDQGYADMPPGPDEYANNDPYSQTPSPAAPMGAAGHGMRRPGDDPYGSRTASPGPGAGYRGMAPTRAGNNSPAPYGMDRMRNSPGPRASPRPQGDPYARSPRQTPVSANGPGGFGPPGSPARENFNHSYSPGPQRQYAQSPRPIHPPGAAPPASPLAQQQDVPSSPIVNNSGFDFTSGFSRPQTAEGNPYDRRPSESRETPGNEGYPGYKPYRPAQDGWSGV